VSLAIADTLFAEYLVDLDYLLGNLYHEGAHLLGIGNDEGQDHEAASVSAHCLQFHDLEQFQVEYQTSGGSGDGDDDSDDDEGMCMAIEWRYKSTGMLYGYEILYCY
jgi:hypothetical protein